MASDIYIEYADIKQFISVKDLNIYNHNVKFDKETLKIYSVKTYKNIIFQDIIIQTSKTIILIQIYKLYTPISNISHGAFIIYQNDIENMNRNNTVHYSRKNSNLLLNSITDNDNIKEITTIKFEDF